MRYNYDTCLHDNSLDGDRIVGRAGTAGDNRVGIDKPRGVAGCGFQGEAFVKCNAFVHCIGSNLNSVT